MIGYYAFLLTCFVGISGTGFAAFFVMSLSIAEFRAREFGHGALLAYLGMMFSFLCLANVCVLIEALRAAP